MKPISAADTLQLSPAERIQLVEDIWDTLVDSPRSVPVTPAQHAELGARLEAYRNDPTTGSSWEDVKARILGQE